MRDEFIACGLTSTEYDVLMHLLTRGSRGAGNIAKGLGLKRSTVYSALQALESQKLVLRSKQGGLAIFKAIAAREIPTLLRNKAQSQFENIISSVRLIEPRIERYENQECLEEEETTANQIDSSYEYFTVLKKYIFAKDFCAIWNPQVAITSHEDQTWITQFLTATARKKTLIKEILVEGPMTTWYLNQRNNPNHIAKILKKEELGRAGMIILDGIVLLSNRSENTTNALEIKNSHYSSFMREYFHSFWERLPDSEVGGSNVEVIQLSATENSVAQVGVSPLESYMIRDKNPPA